VRDRHRIRVLQIVTWLGVGGAERLVLTAATRLPTDQFETAVCCFAARGRFADDAERHGVTVWCLGTFPSLRHPVALYRLYRLIRDYAPDVVHTHLQAPNLYGRLVALAAGVPVVIASEHNVYTAKARRYVAVERWLARRTALVAVSEHVRTFLAAQLRIRPSTIHVVENGIAPGEASPERVTALRRRLTLASGRCVFATVASLTPKKGHTYLLDALALLRQRRLECDLVLAGEGPERFALEQRAAAHGLADRVHFLGVYDDIADVLALADVFVLPSLVEGLPLALLEAMAAGKAIVATSVGGVPDAIVSGADGVLVEARSPSALADALQALAADDALRERLGRRARQTVAERFTEQRHLDGLASLYRSLVARPIAERVEARA
jgi:glycosyltransferase involved in cell wall biosynthesis